MVAADPTDALTKTNLPGRVDSGVVGTLRRMVINNQLEQPFRHSEADLLVLYMYDLFGHHSHAARGTLRNALQPFDDQLSVNVVQGLYSMQELIERVSLSDLKEFNLVSSAEIGGGGGVMRERADEDHGHGLCVRWRR